MTERCRYALSIECAKCTSVGAVHVSEDDIPLQGQSCFSVDSVSDGFRLLKAGATFESSRIVCSECGELAREREAR